MKKITLFCIAISISVNVFSQAPLWLWAVGAGGINAEQGNGIATDVNGDIIVTGTYYSPSITFGTTTLTLGGTQDIFVVKFSSSGNVIWANGEGGTASAYSNGIATDASGNIFVTGMFGGTSITFGTITLNNTPGGYYDMFIVKYDSAGNVQWAKKAGGADWDEAKGVSTDASGNVFVTGQYKSSSVTFGTTTLTNSGLVDVFTVKYDGSGNVLWAKKGGGGSNDYGYGISTDANGNAFITGSIAGLGSVFGSDTLHPSGSPSIFTVKYDPSGNVLWAKTPTGGGAGLGIAADAGGNAAVTGWFGGPITFGSTTLTNAGGYDMFIVKYDATGNVLWANRAGGTSDDNTLGITCDATGNIIATGGFMSPSITFGSTTLTNTSSGAIDIFVVKYDSNGNLVWAKGAGGTGTEAGYSVSADAGGDAYITGQYWNAPITFGSATLTNAGSNDFYIAKLSESVGIDDMQQGIGAIDIFPNPATDEIKIENLKSKIDAVEIFNTLGEKVYNSEEGFRKNAETINVSTLSSGIYFVRVRTGEGVSSAKFVKQ
jgi:hypothetical protein